MLYCKIRQRDCNLLSCCMITLSSNPEDIELYFLVQTFDEAFILVLSHPY